MEFNCERRELQGGVSMVEKIVATRSTLPIIGNILFEASKNGIRLSANNLEMGIALNIKAQIVKEGAVLLPAKTLGGIVSKLPDVQVGFKLGENGIVRIAYDQSHFNLHSLPPDEFPMLPKVKDGKSFSLEADVFASMIKQTIFAVSNSEEKYVLTGVLLEFGKSNQPGDNSNFRMVATDGYRLAKRGEKAEGVGAGESSVIVPARALTEVLRVLDGKDGGKVKVTIGAEQISFEYGEIYIVSRIIQGQFPDYKQVIPKKSTIRVTMGTKDFLEAAERAAVVASGSANITRFEVKAGKITLSANTPDVGNIDEVLKAEVKGGDKVQVSFNIRLITDALKAINTEKVALELNEGLSPGVIKPEDGGDYLYIVMPIRTQEAA